MRVTISQTLLRALEILPRRPVPLRLAQIAIQLSCPTGLLQGRGCGGRWCGRCVPRSAG